MWDKLLYGLIYGWAKVHALLPMRFLYVLSDILYLFVYYVIRYRLRVVRRNMTAAFPDKSTAELRALERKFYHHFADYIVETIKMAHISLEEVISRAWIENPELADQLMDQGHPCVMLVMGHYGNWEWFSASTSRFRDAQVYDIYRPLNNRAVDRLFLYFRTKFSAFGIKKNDAVRDIIKLKQQKRRSLVIFLADQTPSRLNLHYWTTFLNQESAILTGPERIARKLDIPVVFVDTQKVKRGYYRCKFVLMTDSPKQTPDSWITEQYARMMEASILREPAYWLWTHKRWKYKREDQVKS